MCLYFLHLLAIMNKIIQSNEQICSVQLTKMTKEIFKRTIYNKVLERFQQARQFIQVLAGPRQVGKSKR